MDELHACNSIKPIQLDDNERNKSKALDQSHEADPFL